MYMYCITQAVLVNVLTGAFEKLLILLGNIHNQKYCVRTQIGIRWEDDFNCNLSTQDVFNSSDAFVSIKIDYEKRYTIFRNIFFFNI